MEPTINATDTRIGRPSVSAGRCPPPQGAAWPRKACSGRPTGNATERAAYLELLSHELRTPVTSIHAAASVLRARGHRADEALRAELAEDIADETERLLRTIGDVLMLAQLEARLPLAREPLLLQRTVPLLLSGERRRRPGVVIELVEHGPLPLVEGDEAGVDHVLRDLLAESSAGPGGSVTVELRASNPTGGEVHVVDRGPVEPVAFGLSRYASRRVMEAMGGRTWVRPRPDGRVERGLWLPAFGRMVDD